jgi:hypothetical protein
MIPTTRKYYYLVAGLPDIILEQNKLPNSLVGFREEWRAHLHPDDFALTETLLAPIDHRNLLNLLEKKGRPFEEGGVFSENFLEEALQAPEQLPDYLREFIDHFRRDEPLYPGLSWENQLTAAFHAHASRLDNAFLRDWFAFERDLENVRAALAARRVSLSLDDQLIGDNLVTQTLRRSHARDFGLGAEWPYIDDVLRIYQNDNLMEREKAIDMLKWRYIDERNTFNYFSVEALLGFLLKASMVERWLSLEVETGRALFQRLIDDLTQSYQFPKEFALK